MPDILAQGRWWSADELTAIAEGWLAFVCDHLDDRARLVAVALPTTPASAALLIGLTSLPHPLVILPTDVRVWRTDPPVPAGTPLVLMPALAHLAPAAEKLDLAPLVLPEPSTRGGGRGGGRAIDPYSGPGAVLFTSGSVGLPKPVFHRREIQVRGLWTRVRAMGLEHGAGIAMEASIAYSQGFSHVATALLLGGPLGLLDPRDHRGALATLANPAFHCWRGTAHFVDALSRCALTEPPIVPRLCVISTPVSHATFDAFVDRFGTPLRQSYATTETGTLTLDDSPSDQVQRDTVGRLLDGVEIVVGERPDRPSTPGEIGPVWARSPWQTPGYGFPPDIASREEVNGLWATRDLGWLQTDGYLGLAGRFDDAIRTRDNRTVNLTQVASSLREVDEVTDAVVVPIETSSGPSFGAVVQSTSDLSVTELRSKLANVLPPWSWPRMLVLTPALPRLPNGKPDRQACARLLTGTSPARPT